MKRVIFFSTYPINDPIHGGQIRSQAIFRTLRSEGFECVYCSIFNPQGYKVFTSNEIYWSYPVDNEKLVSFYDRKMRVDVHASLFVLEDIELFEVIKKRVVDFDPDIVILEQPWLWPLIREIDSHNKLDAAIVYSSQNVEENLLQEILLIQDEDDSNDLCKIAANIERELLTRASGVIAVSTQDANYFKQFNNNVVVAPNGVWPLPEPGGYEYWMKRYENITYAIFVGSAHPPNAKGFNDMLWPDVTFLRPDESIVVVGDVKNILVNSPLFVRVPGLNESRIEMLGRQDINGLSSLIYIAKCVLIPITIGGGTNLKTAEALYNRKDIVATPQAFRGYEKFMDFPNVRIAQNNNDFRQSIAESLRSVENRSFTIEQDLAIEALHWKSSLSCIGVFIRAIVRNNAKLKLTTKQIKYVSLTGWHPFEEDTGLLWSSSTISALHVKLPNLRFPIFFTCRMRSYRENSTSILACIYTISGLKFSAEIDSDYIDIELQFNENDCFGNVLEVYFTIPELLSPSMNDKSDSRFLGIGLVDIRFNY